MPENIAVIRRLTEEGFVGGKIEVIDDVFAPNFVDHDPMPDSAGGVEGQRQVCQMVIDGLSNRQTVQDEHLSVGDKVIENWTFQGTHTGEFLGIPATGKEIQIRGIEIWRLENGKIVERWGVADIAAVLEQLGVLPPPS